VLPGVAAQACVAEPGRKALARLSRPLLDAAQAEGVLSRLPRSLVVDVAAVNGMALPGGRVLLTRGLIEQARSPDEVAGVLAHELGHVIEAHPEQGMVRALGVSGLARLAALGGPDLSTAALDTGAGLTTLASTRVMERQADGWALRLMQRARVSPAGLAGLLRRLANESHGGSGFALLANHPAPEERLARLAAAPVPEAPLQLLDTREWQELRAICSRREPVTDAVKASR
jgi:predicted Zn-dependent protease